MGWIREVIENIEHNERIFEYNVSGQGIFPFVRFDGSIQILERSGNRSAISWKGVYAANNKNIEEINEMLRGLFEKGINGLEELYLKNLKSSVLL